MKLARVIFPILSLMVACLAAGQNVCPSPTNAPARIALRDQFDFPRALTFPSTNVTLLTIADKKGSEQIAAWVTPIKARFPEGVAIEGIADVSAVPGPLRGLVRRKFQKAQSHPVMMDWSGDTAKAFAILPDRVNIFLVNYQGNILMRMTGKATDEAIKELCETIEQNLADAQK